MDQRDHLSAARGVINGVLYSIPIWLVILITASWAWGATEVVLTPPRAELGPTDQAGYWRLVNRSPGHVTYQVSTVPLMAHEAAATDICAQLLFAPKSLTIAPGASQVVRFLIRSEWSGSEERCRVKFDQIPPDNLTATHAGDGAGVGLHLMLGFSSPVVRGAGL